MIHIKHLLWVVLTAASIAAQAQTSKINAHITDWGSDCEKVVVTARSLNTNETVVTDTVRCKKGKFNINVPNNELIRVMFFPIFKPSKDGSIRAMMMGGDEILLFPGDKVSVKGPWSSYSIYGSPFYTELNEAESTYAGLIAKRDSIIKASPYIDQNDKAAVDRIRTEFAAVRKALGEAQMDYIRQHPTSLVSAFLFYARVDVNCKDEGAFNLLQGEARNGVFKRALDAQEQAYREKKMKEKTVAGIMAGKPAPDFTLKTADGAYLSLSSLRGKYVVLDFWGSWCGWCIKGFPDMKAYYEKYKSKVEFVGIACGDTQEKWQKALAEHQLPWKNVLNGSGDDNVTILYAINGYPTKVIIDAEGKIVKTVVGESPEFYSTLDSLLGK